VTTAPKSHSGDQAFSHTCLRHLLFRRPPSVQSFQKADLVPQQAMSRFIFRQSSFHTYDPDATEHLQRWDREGAEAWPSNGSLPPCPPDKEKERNWQMPLNRPTKALHPSRHQLVPLRSWPCRSPVSRQSNCANKKLFGQVHCSATPHKMHALVSLLLPQSEACSGRYTG
jgi:hypothetical protein